MKNIFILFVTLLCVQSINAQTFSEGAPDSFTNVGFQVDLFGSIEKKGMDSVLSFSVVDFGYLEYELSIQSIINKEGSNDNVRLTYIEAMFGAGYMATFGDNGSITPGLHGGMIYRPSDIMSGPEMDGWQSYLTYGATLKGRYWLSDKLAVIVSGSYDLAPDVEGKDYRINGRAGLEFRLN